MSELWQDESFLQSFATASPSIVQDLPVQKKNHRKVKQRARFVYIEDPSGGENFNPGWCLK